MVALGQWACIGPGAVPTVLSIECPNAQVARIRSKGSVRSILEASGGAGLEVQKTVKPCIFEFLNILYLDLM